MAAAVLLRSIAKRVQCSRPLFSNVERTPCLLSRSPIILPYSAPNLLLSPLHPLQVRSFAGKRSRTGRLQHFRFGTDRVKGRWYYRFHKVVGKWNWRRYTERFTAPRTIENRQRFIPSAWPLYTQARHSYSWYWRLPRELAAGTNADEVLEAWIKFRHKLPKKTYHYFKVLQRLVEVGGCDATDWRLKFIIGRLHNIHRKVLNLPRLAHFYARLGVINELEHLNRFLYPMLPKYTTAQLVLVAHSHGVARVQDKRLMSEAARILDPRLVEVTPRDLVRLAQAFAAVEVCHYTFLLQISAQAQVRVQQASDGTAPAGSCPSFTQLSELAEAFARIKLQDYSFFEMCSVQAVGLLNEGLPGPTPPSLARLCGACSRLKVHEVRLYEAVLAHVSAHWYDYPATSLAEIGAAAAPVLPLEPEPVQRVYRKMFDAIQSDRDTLTLKGIELSVRFMGEVDSNNGGEFMPGLAQALARRLKGLKDDTKEYYDVARTAEAFARNCHDDRALFSILCRHLHRHLGVFEPVDFIRFARSLSKTEYRDDRVTHAIDKWANKRRMEFSEHDWHALGKWLSKLGATETRLEDFRQRSPPAPKSTATMLAA